MRLPILSVINIRVVTIRSPDDTIRYTIYDTGQTIRYIYIYIAMLCYHTRNKIPYFKNSSDILTIIEPT